MLVVFVKQFTYILVFTLFAFIGGRPLKFKVAEINLTSLINSTLSVKYCYCVKTQDRICMW